MKKANCKYHQPRTMLDTSAGIFRRCAGANIFFVHCLKCCSDFGPYSTLAAAQAVGRECAECAIHPLPARA